MLCLPAKLLIGLKPKAKYSVLPVCHVMSHSPEITLIKSTVFSKTVNYHPQFQQHTPSGVNVAFSWTPSRICRYWKWTIAECDVGWPLVAQRSDWVLWKLVKQLKTFNGDRLRKTGFCHHVIKTSVTRPSRTWITVFCKCERCSSYWLKHLRVIACELLHLGRAVWWFV